MSQTRQKLLPTLFAALGIALAVAVAQFSTPHVKPEAASESQSVPEDVSPATAATGDSTAAFHDESARHTIHVAKIDRLVDTTPAHLGANLPPAIGELELPRSNQASRSVVESPITQVQHQQPAETSASESRLVNTLLDLLSEARQQSQSQGARNEDEPAKAAAEIAPPTTQVPQPAEPIPPPVRGRITQLHPGEGDDRLQIYLANQDLREVLAMLSEQGNLNILPSKSVQGTVSASLNGVSVEQALDAILRSTGYIGRREGKFIYVGTPLDFEAMAQVLDKIGTRIYRPNYVTAAELRTLITPLLSPAPIGKIQASSPSKVDIGPDSNKAGGDDFAGTDAVLVQDYESVLCAVDQIVAEIDLRPAQVAIEAMILSVRLNDTSHIGVDFQFLRDKAHLRLATGSPLTDLAQVDFNGGFKFAYLDGNLGAFVSALETIGDTNVIATPRLMALNKHRAEFLSGSQLGYVSTSQTETSTTQNVEFLEVGASLRLRPFIANDGLIRMEIHPELSTGSVKIEGGFTLPDKEVTQVTTNIMVRDGYTLVIGGLMREDTIVNTTQVPLLGSLPYVGPFFRTKDEELEKREIIVLITPRIVHEPQAYQEGEQGAGEFHRRQTVYADKMSPLGKRYLGRKYFRLAQDAWARGNARAAQRLVALGVHLDPQNRAAIDLQSDLWAGTREGDHSSGPPTPVKPFGHPLDGAQLSPFILEQLVRPAAAPGLLPSDPGRPGYSRRIERMTPQ